MSRTVPKLYKRLLSLYPQDFKEQLVESMEQTFNDLYREHSRQSMLGSFRFVLWTFTDTALGITREHLLLMIQGDQMKSITTNPKLAALVGLFFIAPLVVLNAIIGNRIEPFFSIIRPGIHTGPYEYPLLFIVLLLIPIGSFIAIRPLFQKAAEGKRKFYFVNILLAVLLLTVFVILSIALGSEIYRCDILQIPNCD